jgi:hypothetical protein
MSNDIATMTDREIGSTYSSTCSTGGEDREVVLLGASYTNANTFSSGLEAMRLTAPDMALHCMCSPSQSALVRLHLFYAPTRPSQRAFIFCKINARARVKMDLAKKPRQPVVNQTQLGGIRQQSCSSCSTRKPEIDWTRNWGNTWGARR